MQKRAVPLRRPLLMAGTLVMSLGLAGWGYMATLSVHPETVRFPPTWSGEFAYEMVEVTNHGTEDDRIIGFLPAGGVLWPTQAGTCNFPNLWHLPAGTSCTTQLGFHPPGAGRYTETITIHFESGATLAVEVSGTGRGRPQ